MDRPPSALAAHPPQRTSRGSVLTGGRAPSDSSPPTARPAPPCSPHPALPTPPTSDKAWALHCHLPSSLVPVSAQGRPLELLSCTPSNLLPLFTTPTCAPETQGCTRHVPPDCPPQPCLWPVRGPPECVCVVAAPSLRPKVFAPSPPPALRGVILKLPDTGPTDPHLVLSATTVFPARSTTTSLFSLFLSLSLPSPPFQFLFLFLFFSLAFILWS